MLELIRAGDSALDDVRQASMSERAVTYAISDVRVLAPLPRPGKILCSGVNYRSHQEEEPGAVLPETPGFFSKFPAR
jgi:2-keto-4-pentenoate hydratase/2-oxohepta-3-ene-1,7-dioic acid hydratase in catechol pathway